MSSKKQAAGEEIVCDPWPESDSRKRRTSREWPARFPRSSAPCSTGERSPWIPEHAARPAAADEPGREVAIVEELLAEFNETLRLHGRADFSLLERCPREYRKELLSLCNVAALCHRALAPEREARRKEKS